MPPIMGVAAFIMAALTGVPYREIIIAAALPALFYFLCLFLSVVFQARKQKITAIGELTDDMHIGRQDILNLIMIFLPILIILVLLLTSKENVGCGPVGWLLGVERVFHENGCRADVFLAGKKQHEDDQNGQEDHNQVQNVLPPDVHVVGQFSNGGDLLFAGLKDDRQEEAEEIGHGGQGSGL